ncbi:MAG: ADP-ribosylation factor-like protein, partial [Bacteroidota bacterium]
MIWDIAGQESMTDIPQYYLNGCSGFIYVIDLSRPSTYENIQSQLMLMQGMMPEAVRVVAGNKKDLLSEEDLEKVVGECAIKPEILTSAKFDQNVEELFQALAGKMLANHETT